MAEGFYFEDLYPGLVLRSPRGITMDEERMIAFAREFDPHPAHVSHESAKGTMFGRLCASGWYTASTSMRLIFETLRIAGGGAGSGIEGFRWPRPVYPGDTLRVVVEIMAARPSRSRPADGVVTYRCVSVNQDGQAVLEFTSTILVPRRVAEA